MPKRFSLVSLLFYGLNILAGVGIGLFTALIADEFPFGWFFNILLSLLIVLTCFLMQVFAHEFGHLLFGLMRGFSFQSFRIFSWVVIKKPDGFHFAHQRLPGTLGQALMVPPEKMSRKAAFWYNMGGSFFNLLISLVALGLSLMLSGFWRYIAILFSLCGFLIVLDNGFPFQNGLVANDGANTRMLLKRASSLKAFNKQMQINALNGQDIRLKDMDPELFVLEEPAENMLESSIEVFIINRLVDLHDFDQALIQAEALLERPESIPGIYIGLLENERDFIRWLKEEKSGSLSQNQQLIIQSMKDNPSILRYLYARALFEQGDEMKARSIRKSFDELAKSYPYQADYQSEKELLETASRAYEKEACRLKQEE